MGLTQCFSYDDGSGAEMASRMMNINGDRVNLLSSRGERLMAARRCLSARPGVGAAKTGNGNTFKSRRPLKNGRRTNGERHVTERERIASLSHLGDRLLSSRRIWSWRIGGCESHDARSTSPSLPVPRSLSTTMQVALRNDSAICGSDRHAWQTFEAIRV